MSYNPPKKNATYVIYTSLISRATGQLQANPTLADGDAKVSIDGGAFNNLTTLPDVDPDAGVAVKISLSAAEMNGDNIQIALIDAAGAEWNDQFIALQTAATQFDDIVDAVWDEVLTGATHNVATSAGRRLRQLASVVVHDGTAVSATVNTITLDAEASSTDGAYDPSLIYIATGTGAGQCRLILEYDGGTKTAVVDRDWKTVPDATSTFVIIGDAGREHVNEGLARGGTSTTITLNALASSNDDAYIGQRVFIRSGTGEDQCRRVSDYNGTTKVATLTRSWDIIPDTTSAYVMLPTGAITDADIDTAVWTAAARTLTQSAASTAAAVSGSSITVYRGDSLSAAITGLGSISGRTKLWFTVKSAKTLADAASTVQIEETGGLLYLNGATTTTSWGSITVSSEALGNLTIALDENATYDLSPATYYYDIQVLNGGSITTLTSGLFIVSADVTRVIS